MTQNVQAALRRVQARMEAVLTTLRLWEAHAPTFELAHRCNEAQMQLQAQLQKLIHADGVELQHAIQLTDSAVRTVRQLALGIVTAGVLNDAVGNRGRLLIVGLAKSLRELQYWQDRSE